MKRVSVVLSIVVLLAACIGCGLFNQPVAQPQTQIIRQDEASAKVQRQKDVALQHFQEFRVAGTFSAGVKALDSMELALGSVGLTNADIPVKETEITAHLWDLAHRRPVKKVVPPTKTVAHNKIKSEKQRK